jgi:GNAT superfamily N-acetyltransferase
MVTIRRYRQSDFEPAARLVRDLFAKFIMPDATPEGEAWWSSRLSLGRANREDQRRRYAREPLSFVAVENRAVVGIVTGTRAELTRLFVRERHHGNGIGRKLVARFEAECRRIGGTRYRIVASLHAVPFYERMGCRKTTGVRTLHGLPVQPMRKVLPGRHAGPAGKGE